MKDIMFGLGVGTAFGLAIALVQNTKVGETVGDSFPWAYLKKNVQQS